MVFSLIKSPFLRFGRMQTVAFLLFFSSLPIWYVSFGGLSSSEAQYETMIRTAFLAAMFTALLVLLICLFRTSAPQISSLSLICAVLAYIVGFSGLGIYLAFDIHIQALQYLFSSGLGFGAALLCLAWAQRTLWSDLRVSLAGIFVTAFCGCLLSTLLCIFFSCETALSILAVLGCFGSVLSCLSLRRTASEGSVSAQQSNWWDIFGRFDVSVVAGSDEFEAPVSRILFFVVCPLLVLFLLLSNAVLISSYQSTISDFVCIAGDIAVVCVVPLLFIKSDRALISFAFRTFVPSVAFLGVTLAAFSEAALSFFILHVCIGAFCTLYAILMCALLESIPGRMNSLALPCASLLILIFSLTNLLVFLPREFEGLSDIYSWLTAVFLIVAVVLLSVLPTSRTWHIVMDALPASEQTLQETDIDTRCEQVVQIYGLTDREACILTYLARGYGASYIAQELKVAESTLRTHRSNIYKKLGVTNREGLIDLVSSQTSS